MKDWGQVYKEGGPHSREAANICLRAFVVVKHRVAERIMWDLLRGLMKPVPDFMRQAKQRGTRLMPESHSARYPQCCGPEHPDQNMLGRQRSQ